MNLNRNLTYKFPKVQIYQCSLSNFLEDKIDLDLDMYKRIGDYDLLDFGAWSKQFYSSLSLSSSLNLHTLIDDLIGIRGMSKPTKDEISEYVEYFNSQKGFRWKKRKLIKDFFLTESLLTDLGSVIDLSIIMSVCARRKLNVLEIGGGYGRLAQASHSNTSIFSQWNMVDVIPSSLLLAFDYLRRNEVPVGQSEDSDYVRLLQLHDLDAIRDDSLDLAINIESFQEMTQDYVDFWLQVVDSKCKIGATFYQSNSFGYKNKFQLSLKSNWILEHSYKIPRHWTESHRTEIWRKVQ
jgi:hypothetical protein